MKTHAYVVSALLLVGTPTSQQLLLGQSAGLMLIADRQAVGRPGLNVVVDAGSADELLAYAKDPSSLVHGLVGSVAAETKLRNALLAADQTDRITVSIWDGTHIPFVENTVNQVVCDKVTDEVRRALAPYGVAVTSDGKSLWTKPYPKEMDEWPQYLHQANGNCVSQDMIVSPPRRIQWVGAPRTSRHHDHLSSLSAMVSAIYSFGRRRYGWGSAFRYNLYRAKGGEKKSGTWSVDIPFLARSLVKAGDKLIVAGPTRLYDENEAIQTLEDPSTAAKVKAQAESWNKTADLLVIAAADGNVEQKVSFDFAPVWDGIAVAEEALFLSATDGILYRLQ